MLPRWMEPENNVAKCEPSQINRHCVAERQLMTKSSSQAEDDWFQSVLLGGLAERREEESLGNCACATTPTLLPVFGHLLRTRLDSLVAFLVCL
jgi:hypothetical protein